MNAFAPEFYFTCKLDQIDVVVQSVLERLKNGGTVILQGDLAAGKTTFVQKFAEHFGLKDIVTSPTFSIQQSYDNKIFHYDIYNKGLDNFLALGLLEELERDGYHFVEWGDERLYNILKSAHMDVIILKIEKENSKRKYRIIDA
ncbi:MAG: tRNA (adenosine(37)-N6)-threonylcarbamoyltransferase complex ATPase subunit type 1 TsaE [Campylobacterota bacterium]|nr:tRNA (adenosine(37)-N6)-threonylcarbamoyltransferase complex ATPase subunit type 1 TsaE [Campylobacterota bacterium]